MSIAANWRAWSEVIGSRSSARTYSDHSTVPSVLCTPSTYTVESAPRRPSVRLDTDSLRVQVPVSSDSQCSADSTPREWNVAECVRVGEVLLCFPARLFEHAVEHGSDRLASVVLRECEVGAGHAELFGVLETCDLLERQLVGEVSPGGRVVIVRSHGLPSSVVIAPQGVYPISHWAHIGRKGWLDSQKLTLNCIEYWCATVGLNQTCERPPPLSDPRASTPQAAA